MATGSEDYFTKGYTLADGLIPVEVANAFLAKFLDTLKTARVPLDSLAKGHHLLQRPAVEIYGYDYSPMLGLLWGMTPIVKERLGLDLLPTYSYLRFYRQGDICRVHSDRYSCEHSLSLTLAYSDGKEWALEVGPQRVEAGPGVDDGWTGEFSSVAMRPGDGVLYQGVHYRHGRTTPNPNRWSAHMFLHWVDRNGPYAKYAFDGQMPPSRIELA